MVSTLGEWREKNLVALDVDGVLNGHRFDEVAGSNRVDHERVAILNEVLLSCNAKVVLTSAWRYHVHRNEMNLEGINWLFRSHGLASGSIVGVTEPDTPTEWDEHGRPCSFVVNERASQVSRWRLRNNHVGHYVVVDDMDLGFTEKRMPFIQTDGSVGLTPEDGAEMIRILQGLRDE